MDHPGSNQVKETGDTCCQAKHNGAVCLRTRTVKASARVSNQRTHQFCSPCGERGPRAQTGDNQSHVKNNVKLNKWHQMSAKYYAWLKCLAESGNDEFLFLIGRGMKVLMDCLSVFWKEIDFVFLYLSFHKILLCCCCCCFFFQKSPPLKTLVHMRTGVIN